MHIYTVKYMYYYQYSPTCFGAYYAIFRENFILYTKLSLYSIIDKHQHMHFCTFKTVWV